MGPAHPECFQRVDVITDMLMTLRVLDMLAQFDAPAATREELLRVHEAEYLDFLESIIPESGYRIIDLDTAMNPRTLQAARFAAGSVVFAVDQVMHGKTRNAFCNVRPPGHHATADTAMGFCFYNNVAVGAAHAIAEHGAGRVAIIDFDVHHGNGTDAIFSGNDKVRFFSLYERGLFPLDGSTSLAGGGAYVELPPGTGGDEMRQAVEQGWMPGLDAFQPDLVMVSAGFDAHVQDDISSLRFSDADYEWLTGLVLETAEKHAGGRLVSVLEGGYDLDSLARCAGAHIKQLSGL
jgi:acetoin utilization deacetylase AcuC-like enzyme